MINMRQTCERARLHMWLPVYWYVYKFINFDCRETLRESWRISENDGTMLISNLLSLLTWNKGLEQRFPLGTVIHKSISHSVDCLIDQSSFLNGLEQGVGTDPPPNQSINQLINISINRSIYQSISLFGQYLGISRLL